MKKMFSLFMVLALLLTVSYGCTTQPQDRIREVLVTEVTHSVFYAPQYIAQSLGFFEEEGLDVTFSNAGGSDKAMTALLSGEADIGLMGPETAIYVAASGKDDHPLIVGQLTKRDGSFMIGRSVEPDFEWAGLQGKSIIGGRKGGMP